MPIDTLFLNQTFSNIHEPSFFKITITNLFILKKFHNKVQKNEVKNRETKKSIHM